MNKLKINYHTHNRLCNHAVGDASEYVREAINLNMIEIGLSDHGPLLKSFMSEEDFKDTWSYRNMDLDKYKNIYIPEIKSAKEKYGSKISIKFGLECEYLENHDDFYRDFFNDMDYINLGVHFFELDGKIVNSYYQVDYKNVFAYADTCIKAMETGFFTILCHPDLFMWAYKDEKGNRSFDDNARKASKRIIEAAIRTNTILEINANGVLNSEKFLGNGNLLYPDDSFWELASKYKNLKIIIGADAHDPKNLSGDHIKYCHELANRFNLNLVESVSLKNPLK